MSGRPTILAACAAACLIGAGVATWLLPPAAAAPSTGVGLGLASTALAADDHDDDPKIVDLPQLTVRGKAELDKAADQATVRIGVETQAERSRDALEQNSERMQDVVEAIEDAGLTADDYQTGRFRIRPEYSRRPRNPVQDWEPTIIGYSVSNDVVVRTTKLDKVGELIAACNEVGANSVAVEGFELADPDQYRDEVIRAATARAIADATTLADAAGLELVRILRIEVDPASPGPLRTDQPRTMRMAAADSAPPIDPGMVQVSASVGIVYEVRTRGGG